MAERQLNAIFRKSMLVYDERKEEWPPRRIRVWSSKSKKCFHFFYAADSLGAGGNPIVRKIYAYLHFSFRFKMNFTRVVEIIFGFLARVHFCNFCFCHIFWMGIRMKENLFKFGIINLISRKAQILMQILVVYHDRHTRSAMFNFDDFEGLNSF